MIKVWDEQPIFDLHAQGYSSYRIVKMLDLPITARQVCRILKKAGLSRPRTKIRRKPGDHPQPQFFDIVRLLMIQRGDDPRLCALCGDRSEKEQTIHHTKYEGATLADLVFACWKCQNAPVNKGLV